MDTAPTTFAIPTYRLRDVGETIERYDDNFWRNGHATILRENSLFLEKGTVDPRAIVKTAQTFRTGTNDIDAIDFVDLFLQDDAVQRLEDINDVYVLVNFRPVVTKRNWRMDCGVAAYDNRHGLPPFFPTRLRFEDYIYRVWIQREGIAAAHIDAVQNHIKSNYMRNPPAAEVFNEEVCNLVKRKLTAHPYRLDEHGVRFDYDGEVQSADTAEILERITALHARVLAGAAVAPGEERKQSLLLFAENLERAFYGFEADFFQQNVSRIVDDVVSQIQGALELWPTLVEICYFQRHTKHLPKVRVANTHLGAG